MSPELAPDLSHQAFRYALDPTPSQLRSFAQHAGFARYSYNCGVAWLNEASDARFKEKESGIKKPTVKIPSDMDLQRMWREFRDKNDLEWSLEPDQWVYKYAMMNARTALNNCIRSWTGQRAGPRMGRPQFKKKGKSKDSFVINGNSIKVIDNHHVKLGKIGTVKTKESAHKLLRRLNKEQLRIMKATVSRTAGQWLVAFTVEIKRPVRTKPSVRQRDGGVVGVDVGTKHLATLSTGEHIPNPRPLEAMKRRLKKAQQDLSRCEKGSKRREKAKARVAKLHAQVANQRLDALHKLTSRLAHEHTVIAIEDLNVKGMTKSSKGTTEKPGKRVRQKSGLNRAILDSGWSIVRQQLTYKTSWYGSQLHLVPPAYTSQMCSSCGHIDKENRPSQEKFLCVSCGFADNADVNAARNILQHAVDSLASLHMSPGLESETRNARGEDVSPEPGSPG